MTAIDLDGPAWSVREALGLSWQWYASAPDDRALNNAGAAAAHAARTPGWLPATVPGGVVTDLWRAGEVPHPYRARNTRSAEWASARSWVYRRSVDVPALQPGERAVLELDGVDPGAHVVWDGDVVGRAEGPFRRTRLDLTPGVRERTGSRHRLAVVVDPAAPHEPQVGRTDRVRRHAPRMSYGWDFCPRLPHQGIWRSVRLVVGAVHLAGVSARPAVTAAGDGTVTVHADVEAAGAVALALVLRAADGATVATTHATVHPGAAVLTLAVPRPQRWWPAGHGAQPLFRLELTATAGDGGTARWERSVGFRDVRMVPNPGAPDGARPYTAVVNGRRVDLLGWNWVPADVQYGAVPAGRLEHLLDLAARSGACLLRVWGGGLVETEEFYDACDRLGLMVWQELSQSSSGMQSAPATDEEFVALMRAEAGHVVPPRTHHPSLLMWGGGNELEADGVPLDEAHSPVLAALAEEVARLDPGRHWVPTSPSGPAFHHRLEEIAAAPQDQHDVHGPWEHQGLTGQHALYDGSTCLAHTEFGVEGMTNLRTLRALVPAQHLWPAGRENPVYRHLGDWWNNAPLVQRCFGGRLADLERLQRASQLLQATGLGYAVEAHRRRSPRLSMVLPWQLNESYPNAWCTSAVDHRGDPKPAWHAVRHAFAADRVTLQTPTPVWHDRAEVVGTAWVWSRAGAAAGSTVRMRLRDTAGTVLAEEQHVLAGPVSDPAAAGALRLPTAGLAPLLVWDLEWTARDGSPIDRTTVLAATGVDLAALLDLPAARLDVDIDGRGTDHWRVRVRHAGGPAVVGLQVLDARDVDAPGWAVVAAADTGPLLPGRSRTLDVTWRDAGEGERCLRVESWNTAPRTIGTTS